MRYLTLAELIELHRRIIEQSGGADGIRYLGLAESALAQPQMSFGGTELYPTLAEKAAALCFSLMMNHSFVDGNKRIGHAAMETFHVMNGFELDARHSCKRRASRPPSLSLGRSATENTNPHLYQSVGDFPMKERTTQFLLAMIVIVLVAKLLRDDSRISAVYADESTVEQSVVRAQAFELVDKQGKVVAQMHIGEDGGGNIRLRSGDGMVRVKLGASTDGSGLILFDTEASPAVHLAANKSGTSATLAEKGKEKRVIQP